MVVVVVLIAKIFFSDGAREKLKFENSPGCPPGETPHSKTFVMGVTTRATKMNNKRRAEENDDQPSHKVVEEPSELDVLRLEYQALREQNAWLFRRLENVERENEELLGRRRRPTPNLRVRSIDL